MNVKWVKDVEVASIHVHVDWSIFFWECSTHMLPMISTLCPYWNSCQSSIHLASFNLCFVINLICVGGYKQEDWIACVI